MTTIRNLFALSILTLTMTFALACDAPEAIDVDAEDFRFLLPTVCASPDGSDVFISDFTCGVEDWQVCDPGEYHENATQRVCCPWGSEDGCRIANNQDAWPCYATETNPCDRSPFNNVHACSTDGEDIYLRDPYCDAGDIFLCAEGDFAGTEGRICCTKDGACDTFAEGSDCPDYTSAVCDAK
jgi:hypothetical protein